MTVMRSRFVSPWKYPYCGSLTARLGDEEAKKKSHTFPTAASPSRTSLTLLLGLGGTAAESAIVVGGCMQVHEWKGVSTSLPQQVETDLCAAE